MELLGSPSAKANRDVALTPSLITFAHDLCRLRFPIKLCTIERQCFGNAHAGDKCPTKSFLVKCSPVLRTIVCHICDTSPSTSGAVSVRYVRTLTESQRHTLETLMKHDPSPRARARAHSILLSSRRVTIKEIVKIYQVDRDTVSSWIKKWEQTGVESLYDKPRSGRPSKLTQEEKELAQH